MIPTPTDAATAIMSAAIATAVRLSAAVTPRVAIRPSTPSPLRIGVARSASTSSSGSRSAVCK